MPKTDSFIEGELARLVGTKGAEVAGKAQEEFAELVAHAPEVRAIVGFLDKVEKENGLNLEAAREFARARYGASMASERQFRLELASDWATQGFLNAFLGGKKEMKALDLPVPYSQVKLYLRSVIQRRYEQNDATEFIEENKFIYPFLVSNDFDATGTLVMKLFESPQDIELVRCGLDQTRKPLVKFFGEKGAIVYPADSFSAPLYVYQFVRDVTKEEFFVFSPDELSGQHCRVRGMLAGQPDALQLGGRASNMAIKMKCVFAVKVEPDIVKWEQPEFDAFRLGAGCPFRSHDGMAKALVGGFRHPVQFEQFLFAWLFSGKHFGWPLHIGWLSDPGGGKTFVLKSIAGKVLGENTFDGSQSTFKHVIPSFGGALAEPGFLSKARRVAVIDELFTALRRNGSDDLDEQTAHLTSMLEHLPQVAGSGKHKPITINVTAKACFASNPRMVHGLANMIEMATGKSQLNNAFLSRVLWYFMTPSHYQLIQRNKGKFRERESHFPTPDAKVVSAIDYLNGIFLPGDAQDVDVERIVNAYEPFVPAEIQASVYRPRVHHHVSLLIDGVAKYNSLVQGRPELCVLPEDISLAEELFAMCVLSWSANVDLSKVPPRQKKNYLTLVQREAFEFVEKQPGIKEYDVLKAGHARPTLDALVSKELLVPAFTNDGKRAYWPFWSNQIPQSDSPRLAQTVAPESLKPTFGSVLEASNCQLEVPERPGAPRENEWGESVRTVLSLIREELKTTDLADEANVIVLARGFDVEPEKAREVLTHLKASGEVWEPLPGQLKVK